MQGTSLLVLLACARGVLCAEFFEAENEAMRVLNRYIIRLDNSRVYAASVDDRLAQIVSRYDETMVAASAEEDERVFAALAAAEVTITSEEALQQLLKETEVSLVEEVQEFRPVRTIERHKRQATVPSWGMDRINQRSLPLDNNIPPEMDMSSSIGVNVYLVDSGVDYTHPDFEGRVIPTWSYFHTNGDGLGHGTHVAGILTSKTYGLSRATVRSIKVLADDGVGSTTTVMAGLNFIAANYDRSKPTVVSMSLGGGFSQAMTDAINQITSYGVPVVAAAGNSNSNSCLYSPASAAAAITVGSITSADEKSSFSNWGQCIDILAPGSTIISLFPGGKTGPMSGTSMSVPHVSSAVAIYIGWNPTATPEQVTKVILDNATLNIAKGFSADTPNRVLFVSNEILNPPPVSWPATTTTIKTTTTSWPYFYPTTTPVPVVPKTTTTTTLSTTTTAYPTWRVVTTTPAVTWRQYTTPYVTTTTTTPNITKVKNCTCVTRNKNLVSTNWCRKYDGCTYFKLYCKCLI